jgi:hypothetical protein
MRLEKEINYFTQNVYFAVYFNSRDGGTTAYSNSKQLFFFSQIVLASQNKQRYYLKIFEKTGICNGDSGL